MEADRNGAEAAFDVDIDEGVGHDGARGPLDRLIEETKGDPGTPFRPETLAALAALKINDRAGYEKLRGQLKSTDCRIGELDKAIDEENGETGERKREAKDRRPPKTRSAPKRFRLVPTGVERFVDDDDGGHWRWFCSPLEVAGLTRDAEGKCWGRLLLITTPDGHQHEWAMPMELLGGDGTGYRSELLGLGLLLAPGRHDRDALHEYVSTAQPEARIRCVSRIGWHDRTFVLPDVTFGDVGTDRTVLQRVALTQDAFSTAGTIEDWQEDVALRCVGNSRLVFAVSAAFAASVLQLVNAESGGFHLLGGSSIGKTTALGAGGSVWGGGGLKGYVRQWRATDNGLEAMAAHHCDALLCLDELSQVDARAAGAVAYMLANGTGKSRAGRSGEGRPPAEWRILFLSSGEIGLADKIAEDGRRRRVTAGQQVRVVDIPADAGVGMGLFENLHGAPSADAFARNLKDAASTFYGTAARAFLAQIVARPDEVGAAIAGFRQDFQTEHCPAAANGQVQRVAGRFALVAAAGELAIALGILPWPRGEAMAAAGACFQAWLTERGGTGPAEITAGIAQVRRFIELHGESRFSPWTGDDRPTINRVGFRRPDGDAGTEYFILGEAWRSELCAGLDPGAIARAMVERGLFLPDVSDKKPQSRHRLPGMRGKVRCYHLSAGILEDGDHA